MKKFFILLIMVGCLLSWSACSAQPETPPVDDRIRVACIGDSITYGTMVFDRTDNAYPAKLQQLLGDSYLVKNYGANGYAMQKTADLSYWEHSYFQASSDFQPHIVLIMLGTNDSKNHNWGGLDYYMSCYREMIAHYQNLASKPIVCCITPPKAFIAQNGTIPFDMQFEVIDAIASALKEMATEDKLPLIDIHAVTDKRELFAADGIHPNADGAQAIAQTVFAALFASK